MLSGLGQWLPEEVTCQGGTVSPMSIAISSCLCGLQQMYYYLDWGGVLSSGTGKPGLGAVFNLVPSWEPHTELVAG